MEKTIKSREEVDINLTWDLSAIFKSEDEFNSTVEEIQVLTDKIENTYKDKLNSPDIINACIDEYKKYLQLRTITSTYAHLLVASDQTNHENTNRYMRLMNIIASLDSRLSFVNSELMTVDKEIIDQAIDSREDNSHYLKDIMEDKRYALTPEVEKALTALSQTLNSFYNIYNQAKLADMNFTNFIVDGKEYPLSFNLFEHVWEYENDTKVRRAAFTAFSEKLREYQNTFASSYQAHIQKEKTLADLRGFDSVFSSLLYRQKVDRSLYDRQIDLIMDKLSVHMRKYAKLLQKIHNLDEMTFADLKLAVDPSYEPTITIEESKKYIEGALSVLGDDYLDMVKKAYKERWIDFVQNKGKSTGAFCSSPYGIHPYILISWSEKMREVFVLAHELGHAGHFYLAQQNQNILNYGPSLYFIEAPSTMNEMLMANYLLKINDDPRFKRWVYSSMISRTYYHNFVTHLLEATYQREVYKIIDRGGSVHAQKLNQLKKDVLEQFWGDTVRINEGAELTWMRQPHYYMGLYSYTYSAGLTIATQASQKILNEGERAINDWREVLQSGGTKTPVELALMVGVDITTDKPLLDTIDYIGRIIEEIINITEKLNQD